MAAPNTSATQSESQVEQQDPTTASPEAAPEKKTSAAEKKDEGKPGLPRPLTRNDTTSTWDHASDIDEYIPRRPRRRGPSGPPPLPRNYSPIPFRGNGNIVLEPQPEVMMLSSSARLLGSVGRYDGVADLTYPARASVYLTTFPFSEKDVRKWAWLFTAVAASGSGPHSMEGEWLPAPPKSLGGPPKMPADVDSDQDALGWMPDYDYERYPAIAGNQRVVRRRREPEPYYEPVPFDIPQLLLSRVLDGDVIPDDMSDEKETPRDVSDVKFWIVVQGRTRNKDVKMLVAESRRAAGILCFYEALNGNSVLFVGAVVAGLKMLRNGGKVRIRKAAGLEEARKMRDADEAVVGVIC